MVTFDGISRVFVDGAIHVFSFSAFESKQKMLPRKNAKTLANPDRLAQR